MSAPVAIVTGAASGIGAAVTQSLRGRGWLVGSVSREPAPHADCSMTADVADRQAVGDAVAGVSETLGSPEAAVACAGHYGEAHVLDIEPVAWHRMLRVHVGGLLNLAQTVVPAMVTRGHGRFVGVSSERAIGGGHQDAHYAAAKGAALALLRTIAVDVAGSGVRVNSVAPGPCDTPLLPADSWERQEAYLATLPARRLASPSEVAAVVEHLVCDDLFVLGDVVSVNSGTVI